jgi:hypothetical protein
MPITIDGTGSISGLSAGGLPDLTVVTADIAAGAVTQAKRSEDLTQGTAVATTSGTSIDFTGIPSWARRVTVTFGAISTNGSSILLLQIGSGSVQTTGYSGTIWTDASSGQFTTGFPVFSPVSAANNAVGIVQLVLMGSNIWAQSGNLAFGNIQSTGWSSAGFTQSALSGALDRIRPTTVNGTDAFDGGIINILYE